MRARLAVLNGLGLIRLGLIPPVRAELIPPVRAEPVEAFDSAENTLRQAQGEREMQTGGGFRRGGFETRPYKS
jgi:hypothetical protein